jgi:hypothetical protein
MDTLVFVDGQADCMQTHQFGFSAARYTCERTGDKMTFTSTMNSSVEGTISWSGTIDGHSISGEFYWPKEQMTFAFTGKVIG